MQVAISVHGAVRHPTREERGRSLTGLEVMQLKTAAGIKGDPLDKVLGLHGMRDLTDRHVDDVTIPLEIDNGDIDRKSVV